MPAPKKPQIHPLLLRIIETAHKIDFLECKNDPFLFIERHVKIEDLDSPGIVIPFRLWEGQKNALSAFIKQRLVVVLKARQLGLTWLALAYAAWRLVFTPGYRVIVLSANEDKAKEMVRRIIFILQHLPIWMIRPQKGCDPKFCGPTYEDLTLSVTIYHKNGEPGILHGLPASPGAGRMFTANLIIIDEWAEQQFAEEIWTSAYPVINRPTGGQVIGLSTAKRGTLFESIVQGAIDKTNNFHLVFLPWWTDPRRTQEWYEQTKKDLPKTYRSEYPATIEEAFSVGEGAFFDEWDENIHVVDHWEPPRSAAWPIIGVYDPAYNQACFKWYTISPGVPGFPRGWARCFREYAPVHRTAYDQAREILRFSCYRDGKTTKIKDPFTNEDMEIPGTPFTFKYIIGDTRAWNRDDSTGISTYEIFAKYGLIMRQADKNVENGWMELHEWLKPRPLPDSPNGELKLSAKLTFTKDCGFTRRTYPACEQSKTNPEDISDKTPHDPQDCDRYFVMSRVKAVDIKPDPLDELRKKFPEYSLEFRIYSRELMQEDPKKEIGLDELGL